MAFAKLSDHIVFCAAAKTGVGRPFGSDKLAPMPPLETRVRPGSAGYLAQRSAMLELLAEVRRLEAKVRRHSGRADLKFHERGQLPPRERLARLLDPGAPFLELMSLAGLGRHDDDGGDQAGGGGSIAGVGLVSGVRCVISASDSGIKGGAIAPAGLAKNLRAQEIASENRLPLVNLVESAGANLLYQSEVFVDGGRVFANLARLSAAGIPVLTVVHGSSTAGGAYLPGLSDYVVVVRGQAKIFLAGPPLVKAALGEDADEESLGGGELHAATTGSAEYAAENDAEALLILRDLLSRLPRPAAIPAPPGFEPPRFDPPRFDPDSLAGAVPVDYRTPYDCREVIARLVDASDFLDFKPSYGSHTVCGHAAIEGQPIGIVGNNGPIDNQGATKAAQFIQLCCQSKLPIVYLQNTTGYMVGKRAEQEGIVKHGAQMIQAVANAKVPQLTLQIGGSFGAGNYGMCGRAFGPRFIFSWPNSRIAVMGSEQAADVMAMVAAAKAKRAGQPLDPSSLAALRAPIVKQLDAESTALFGTARLWDDGIIDPRDSRKVLALCLQICREAEARKPQATSFGVARF
jgi:geranyl-CoA carboxylase beta subunit